MSNNDINASIQRLVEIFQEQFHFPNYELDNLFGFFKVLVNRAADPENICPYGLLVQYNKKEQRLRDSFLDVLTSALSELPISRKYSIAEINESNFSNDSTLPGVLGLKNAVNAVNDQPVSSDADISSNIIFLLKNCSEMSSLDHLISEFENHPDVIKIICATEDVVENRFRKNDHFFYRLLPDHIHLHAQTAPVIKSFLQLMTDTGFKYDEGFESEISYYIDTIYREADYKDSEFNQDLLRRIELRMEKGEGIHAYKEGLVVDKSFVPYSSKVVAARREAEVDDQINEAETHVQTHHFTAKRDHINVLLLALSTFPLSKKITKSEFQYANADGSNIPVIGRYQLDPVPKLLDRIFADRGESLDRIIMLGTEVTRKPIEITTPEKEKRTISPECYFKQQVTNYMNPDLSEDQKFIFIPVSEDNPYAGISDVINALRNCPKELDNALHCGALPVHLYIDTHGGLRGTQRILEATTLLLGKTESNRINFKDAFSVEMRFGDINIIRTETENIKIFDFVAGVNEFMSCGRADTLNKYAETNSIGNDPLVSGIRAVALGIQLCNITEFENGLKKLHEYFNNKNHQESNYYLDIYRNDIKADYGKLVSDNYNCVDEITWCYRHGFYQQAITLAESKISALFLDKWKFLKFNKFNNYGELTLENGVIIKKINNIYYINDIKRRYRKDDFFNGFVFTFVKELIKEIKPNINIPDDNLTHYIFDSATLNECENLNDLDNYLHDKLLLQDNEISACLTRAFKTISLQKSFSENIVCPNILVPADRRFEKKTKLFQFFALHKYLKYIRNNTNHAATDNPYNLDTVERTLKLYIGLLNELNPHQS